MKKKLSKILGVGLTIALVASLVVMAAPVSAVGETEVCGFFKVEGAGSAEWVGAQTHTGDYTPELKNANSYVFFVPGGGITVADLDDITTSPEWSYMYHLLTTISGHGPELELRFTSSYCTNPGGAGHVDVTVFSGGTAFTDDNAWHKMDVTSASAATIYYGNRADGTAFSWEAGSGGTGVSTTLGGVINAIEANSTLGAETTVAWELTRVGLQLYITNTAMVDGVTIAGTTYDLEPCYRIIPDTVAKDVKGTEQKFVILNLPMGMSEYEFLTYANPAQAMEVAQMTGTDNVSEVVAWEVIPGLEKSSVGDPGSGADIIVTAGGGPTYPISGGGTSLPQNWIKIWTRDPGDANIVVWLDEDLNVSSMEGPDKDIRLISEKKWGDINHTILDLDPATPIVVDPVTKQLISGQETLVHYVAGTDKVPEKELVDDWIYAWFYKSPVPSTFIDTVGHAVVHWWLIVDDAAGLNEAAIDAIMADLGSGGCGTYADWPAAWGTPFDRIDAIETANPSTKFVFSAVMEGTLAPDPNIDGTFNNDAGMDGTIDTPLDTYIKTMTEDDLLGETRGLVQVELENTGQEDILIVTLTEYPWPYAGENPVCIEKGKKTWTLVPPEVQVKIPQVRWAGEKIVLEKDWGEDNVSKFVTFTLDGGSIGVLTSIVGYNYGNYVMTDVMADGVARVIFETEYEGQAEVKAVLYDCTYDDVTSQINAEVDGQAWEPPSECIPIDNHDFPLFYLKLESIEPLDPTPAPVDPGEDAFFGVQVKGWFWTNTTEKSDEPAKCIDIDPSVDSDGNGVADDDCDQVLPAGRWVLPDDWARLAGIYELRRHWDLMNNWEDQVIYSDNTLWGPFDTAVVTTDVPGEAEYPTIGPFNTTQPVAIEDEVIKWVTTASVIADYWVIFPWTVPPVLGTLLPPGNDWTAFDLRNTVVPDGKIDWFDCPMSPAKVIFQVAEDQLANDLFAALKSFDLEQYFDGGYWYAPYYSEEIPSSWFIPVGGVPEGYNWDSWGMWTTGTRADDGPYDFWWDLGLSTLSSTDDEVIEVYSDNNGIAYVGLGARAEAGEVKVSALADYPYQRKHTALRSEEVTQQWGAIELNPHFVADPTEVDVGDTVTFDNRTTGGTTPYTDAYWDFDADGEIEITLDLFGVDDPLTPWDDTDPMADVTWAYDAPNLDGYSVILWMTDSTPTTRYEERPYYIVVTGEAPGMKGDFDGDDDIDAVDFAAFGDAYDSVLGDANYDVIGDFDDDDDIDAVDFAAFGDVYGYGT